MALQVLESRHTALPESNDKGLHRTRNDLLAPKSHGTQDLQSHLLEVATGDANRQSLHTVVTVVNDLPVIHIHLLHPIKDGEEGRIPPLPKNIVEDHHPSPHQGLLVAEDHLSNDIIGSQFLVVAHQVILNQIIQMTTGDLLQIKRGNVIPILLIGRRPLPLNDRDI